mmetsp:Transcript_67506/g.162020  ORF Transcript_67506/g.162020 Transcript_67506/m.162020 type:complete len:184 (+) Transcript_67506:212-763(+)
MVGAAVLLPIPNRRHDRPPQRVSAAEVDLAGSPSRSGAQTCCAGNRSLVDDDVGMPIKRRNRRSVSWSVPLCTTFEADNWPASPNARDRQLMDSDALAMDCLPEPEAGDPAAIGNSGGAAAPDESSPCGTEDTSESSLTLPCGATAQRCGGRGGDMTCRHSTNGDATPRSNTSAMRGLDGFGF